MHEDLLHVFFMITPQEALQMNTAKALTADTMLVGKQTMQAVLARISQTSAESLTGTDQ